MIKWLQYIWLYKGSIINWFLNKIWNERINEIHTVSYLLYEFKILIKMLKFIHGTIRPHRTRLRLKNFKFNYFTRDNNFSGRGRREDGETGSVGSWNMQTTWNAFGRHVRVQRFLSNDAIATADVDAFTVHPWRGVYAATWPIPLRQPIRKIDK